MIYSAEETPDTPINAENRNLPMIFSTRNHGQHSISRYFSRLGWVGLLFMLDSIISPTDIRKLETKVCGGLFVRYVGLFNP